MLSWCNSAGGAHSNMQSKVSEMSLSIKMLQVFIYKCNQKDFNRCLSM